MHIYCVLCYVYLLVYWLSSVLHWCNKYYSFISGIVQNICVWNCSDCLSICEWNCSDRLSIYEWNCSDYYPILHQPFFYILAVFNPHPPTTHTHTNIPTHTHTHTHICNRIIYHHLMMMLRLPGQIKEWRPKIYPSSFMVLLIND